MTREEKLYSMTMANLQIVADKLGVKINKKAAKSQAVAKILEAEHIIEDTNKAVDQEEKKAKDLKAAEEETKNQYIDWEEEATKEKEIREKKQAEKDKAAEDAVNKPKLVQMPGTDGNWGEKHYAPKPKRGALIEYNGKSQNICAWAKELGKNPNTLYARIYKMNWSIEDAFTK